MKIDLSKHKYIPVIYMIGGVVGLSIFLSQITYMFSDPLSFVATIILLSQIAAAIYGSWLFFKNKALGVQILYWTSASCIPVISFALLEYWACLGASLSPVISIGSYSGFHLNFNFGYQSQLWFFPETHGFTIGINVVALALMLIIKKIMKSYEIPSWPVRKEVSTD